MRESPTLNLLTYPEEVVYVPDMLVTLVALSNFTWQCDNRYQATVEAWLNKAKKEWIDNETGILKSFLDYNGTEKHMPVKGSYSALICYYLTFIDEAFAQEQYRLLKKCFMQGKLITGIREYYDHPCWLGIDIDSGPIICNLSPSGTAFAIGAATYFVDFDFRNRLLKTGEIAGSTVSWRSSNHYLLANVALVGEAITLAMRTSMPWHKGAKPQ